MVSRSLSVAAVAAAAALPAPAAALAPRVTCSAGHTKYAQAGTRLFAVDRRERDLGSTYRVQDFYACAPRQHRPTLVYRGSAATDAGISHIRPAGRFVSFVIEVTADPDEDTWIAGWFRPSTHRVATQVIADTDHPDRGLFGAAALVVASDGSIAALDSRPGERQLLAALVFDPTTRRLGKPKLIYGQPVGDIDPSSLAYAGGIVSWTSTAGERHDVMVDTAPTVTPPPE